MEKGNLGHAVALVGMKLGPRIVAVLREGGSLCDGGTQNRADR